MMEPSDVVLVARARLGTPWAHQRADDEACDCVGLTALVCRDLGAIDAIPPLTHSLTPDFPKLCAGFDAALQRAPGQAADNLAPGLIVGIHGKGFVHVAIIGYGELIHSLRNHGKVISHGLTPSWITLIKRAWQIPGVTYG